MAQKQNTRFITQEQGKSKIVWSMSRKQHKATSLVPFLN